MPRARTGQLYKPGRDGFYRARVTEDVAPKQPGEKPGKARPLYSLGTPDKAVAIRGPIASSAWFSSYPRS